MPQPLRMHQIKRIIEFHQQGHRIRQIERLCGISRNTIREYLRRISLSGLPTRQLLQLTDEELMAILHADGMDQNRAGCQRDERHQVIEQRLEYYKTELAKQIGRAHV